MEKLGNENGSFYLKNIFFSAFLGIALLIALIFLFAFAFLKMSLPLNMSVIPVVISSGIAAIFSGYFCGRRVKEKGWLLGLLCGISIWFVLFIAGLFFSSPTFTGMSAIKLIVIIGGAMTGGMLGVNQKERKLKI